MGASRNGNAPSLACVLASGPLTWSFRNHSSLSRTPAMRHLCPSFFVLSLVAPAFAADPALQEARQLWLRGSYEQARVQYEKLAATPQHKPAATIGVSRAWESQG